jgi:hypothetical protein
MTIDCYVLVTRRQGTTATRYFAATTAVWNPPVDASEAQSVSESHRENANLCVCAPSGRPDTGWWRCRFSDLRRRIQTVDSVDPQNTLEVWSGARRPATLVFGLGLKGR